MDDGMEQPDYAQAYHSHSYLDPLQAQAIAAYMPDFAAMDPASQAAAMQQYSQAMPHEEPPVKINELLRPGFRTETESEAEEGGAAQHGLSIAAADAHTATGDDAWTEAEESDLLRLINDKEFRKAVLADSSTKWGPVARYFKRTVKAIKRKYDKLQNPERETRKSTRVVRSTAAAQAAAQQQEEEEEYAAAVAAAAEEQLHHHLHQQYAAEAAQQDAEGMTAEEHAAAAAVSGALPAAHQDLMAHMYTMGMGHEGMYAAGGEGVLTEERGATALQGNAEAHGMTPEQMAAYMHAYSGFYGNPNEAAAAAEGQQQQQEEQQQQDGDPDAGVDPALLQQLAAQQAAAYQAEAAATAAIAQQHAAQAQGTPPPQSQSQQHQTQTPQSAPQETPPAQHQGSGVGGGTTNQPRNDRVFWKADEQQELLRIVQDPVYRQQALGVSELNWDTVAKHLGRGKRSVQRKYDNLKGALVNNDGTLTLPANDGKKWTPEEVSDLVRLVEDPQYRSEKLAMEKVDWRVLGQHFGRSYESVSYKYSYVKNTGRTGNEGKPKHAKAKHETSYKEMAIWALQQIGGEGTSGQICSMIATNNVYSPQLDTAIVSGKKTLQRWKHGVRSALNAFPMFKKTPRIFEGEVVWHLVEEAVASEAAAAQEKALRQRNKPPSGSARRKIKRPPGEEEDASAGGGEEGGQEEGAQQALAQMASHRVPGGRKRKASAMAQAAQAEAEAVAQAAAVAAAAAAAHAQHQAAVDASAMAGMDPQQMEMLAAHAQMPLLQHMYDPNTTITAEQLAMLPPEHLAMLQQQMESGQLGQQLPVLPLAMTDGHTVEGHAAVDEHGGAVPAEHAHHHHHMAAEHEHAHHHHTAAMHAAQGAGHHQYHDPTQGGAHYHDPQHYDPQAAAAHHAALEQHAHYATAHDASAHDPSLAAQHQHQMADHYAATGMMDPSGGGQHGMHTGVHLGQPMGHHQGMDGMAGLGQQVQGYDHYGQYHQPYQQYQQYQYESTHYQAYDTSQMATYGVPQPQQQQQQQ